MLLALQVKVGKVASFVGKIRGPVLNILPHENYPLYGIGTAFPLISEVKRQQLAIQNSRFNFPIKVKNMYRNNGSICTVIVFYSWPASIRDDQVHRWDGKGHTVLIVTCPGWFDGDCYLAATGHKKSTVLSQRR